MAKLSTPARLWYPALPPSERSLRALCAAVTGTSPYADEWDDIIGLANRLLVTPALADSYRNLGTVPEEIRPFFAAIASRSSRRNTLMKAQLIDAGMALNKLGIVPLAFKGAALLVQQPSGLANRIFADLDLMVSAADMPSAIAALCSVGYAVEGEPGMQGATLMRDGDVGGIDLHCRLKASYPDLEFADLTGDCIGWVGDETHLLLPQPWLHVAMIVLHDQLQERDYWRGLVDARHLIDMWRMAQGQGDEFWHRLVAWFPAGYPRRAVQTQLMTLNWLFGPIVPRDDTGRLGSRAQLLRRRLQMRYPWLAPILTGLTLVLDPPLRPGLVRSGHAGAIQRFVRLGQRLMRPSATQKI
jgi:hypothetical protein